MPHYAHPQGTLIDTFVHCAAFAVFAVLLYLFFLDWQRSGRRRSWISACTAALVLLWHVGALVIVAPGVEKNYAINLFHALSFFGVSLVPALLLHIWLEQRYPPLWITGYALCIGGAGIHLLGDLTNFVFNDLTVRTWARIGFSALTAIAIAFDYRKSQPRWSRARLAGALCLLLLSASTAYFGRAKAGHLHHVGVLFSLCVLLFDYRFLLLGAFVRFVVLSALAFGTAFLVFAAQARLHFAERVATSEFGLGLAFVSAAMVLAAFAKLANMAERLFMGLFFRRPRVESVLTVLRDPWDPRDTEESYLDRTRQAIETFFECQFSRFQTHVNARELDDLPGPIPVLNKSEWPAFPSAPWAEAALPLKFLRGDALLLLLGPRQGRRPYLADDIVLLKRFGKIMEEQVERKRLLQMQALASEAEMRALQAQINPHFFFNSLNTLYGTISRANHEARNLVLSLADIFRYFLRSNRTFITLEEELKIIRAYLEIEALRLGPRLATSIHVDEYLLKAEIPVLSIQPLVDNAVKHGIAPHSTKGWVRLTVWSQDNCLKVEVVNTGELRSRPSDEEANGIGLANLRRRLALCYGTKSELYIASKDHLTFAGFSMPLNHPASDDGAEEDTELRTA
jgi:two-component system LytT family sensor kinase